MQFKDIEGQRILINHLTKIVDEGRVSHAQMFLGPTTSGSLALSIAYAQYLGCTHRIKYPDGSELRADSCGECPNCRKFQELAHPDLHFVFPSLVTEKVKSEHACSEIYMEQFLQFLNEYKQRGTEDKWYAFAGAENKQGLIRERDAANIVRTLGMKSYEGGWKVLIIWLPERMNGSCANELLKTIEEPTPNTLILLACENRDRLLPTIISRVQQIVVPDLGATLSEERRQAFAQMFVQWMRMLFKLDMRKLSDFVDKVHGLGREVQKQFLQYTLESLRACFLKNVAGYELPGELQFGDEKFDSSFYTMITPNNIEQMNNAINGASTAIERNAYAKITFMQLSFTMSKLIKNR